MIQKDCFGIEQGKNGLECGILKRLVCRDGRCPFYKPNQQYAEDRKKYMEGEAEFRERKMPKSKQRKPFNGTKTDCFAYEQSGGGTKCRVMKVMQCMTSVCAFYKTRGKYEDDLRKYPPDRLFRKNIGGNQNYGR